MYFPLSLEASNTSNLKKKGVILQMDFLEMDENKTGFYCKVLIRIRLLELLRSYLEHITLFGYPNHPIFIQ